MLALNENLAQAGLLDDAGKTEDRIGEADLSKILAAEDPGEGNLPGNADKLGANRLHNDPDHAAGGSVSQRGCQSGRTGLFFDLGQLDVRSLGNEQDVVIL